MQTVRFALFQPRTFSAELCRPVRISERDAQRFRMVTVAVASFGAALGLAGLLQYLVSFLPLRPTSAGLAAGSVGVGLAMFVFLRMATDLPTFIWRGLPGRSDDLSPLHQYAAAPLVLMLPAAVLFVALVFVVGRPLAVRDGLTGLGAITLLAIALIVLLWAWLAALIFMRTATRCSFGRVAALGFYLPAHWLMMWLLVWLVIGAVAYYGGAVLEWLNWI